MARVDPNAVLVDLGRRLADLRAERGLTQEQLAAKLDVTVQYVQRVERGSENLTVRSIVRLVNALNITIGELFVASKSPDRPAGRPPKKS